MFVSIDVAMILFVVIIHCQQHVIIIINVWIVYVTNIKELRIREREIYINKYIYKQIFDIHKIQNALGYSLSYSSVQVNKLLIASESKNKVFYANFQ